mgnify:FL=1
MKREISAEKFLTSSPECMSISIESAEKSEEGITEYTVLLTVESLQHLVTRRYNQFYSFDQAVRHQFPRVDLPAFPSKFTIYNKTEQRKKAFHQYMNGILGLCAKFPPLPKDTLMKLVAEFLDLYGAEKKNESKNKDVFVESVQITPESGHQRGYLEVKIHQEDWIRYYASLVYSNLYLFPNEKDFHFVSMISCYGATISKQELANVLEIHQDHQKSPILIRTPNREEWRNALIIVSSANIDSPLASYKINFCGRLNVKVFTLQNLKPLTNFSHCYLFVKVSVDPFTFHTSFLLADNPVSWNQNFVIPVLNRFFVVKVELCSFSSKGWLKQQGKEEVLAEYFLPIPDLNAPPYTNGPVTLLLKKDDTKRKRSAQFEQDLWLHMELNHETDFAANFLPPPSNFLEDIELASGASMRELKIAFKRLKRMQILYGDLFKKLALVFTWIYPQFSKYCMAIYCLMVMFLPSQFILPLVLLVVLLFALSLHPDNAKYVQKASDFLFSEEKRVKAPPKVETIKQHTNKIKSEITFLREKIKEGMMDKWKKFKLDAVELQNLIMTIACYLEKVRQLFLWEDRQKSSYFLVGLAIATMVCLVIPFRVILLGIGVLRFMKGKKLTKNMMIHNRKVCSEVLNSLFTQHLSSYVYNCSTEESWPNDFIQNTNLQRKIADGIRSRLSLEVTTDIFFECPNPAQLLEHLCSVEVMLKMKGPKGQVIVDPNRKEKLNLVKGFISNIPSEYYRFINTSIGDDEIVA